MDSAFFILSKLVGLGLQIETWLAIGLTSSVVAGRRGRPRSARWTGSLTLLVLLIITALPIGELLLRPLEAEFPPRDAPERVDGIVVLGGVEDPRTTEYWDQPQVNQAAERLTAAAALALKHPESRLVFSGGSGRLRDLGEGHLDLPSVAVDVFTSLGISPLRITWEDQSRNTVENARFSLVVATPAPEETWLLITSAFHMGRSVASFEAAGWLNISPYPVDFRTGDFKTGIGWDLAGKLGTLNIALKEWVGRAAYALTGR